MKKSHLNKALFGLILFLYSFNSFSQERIINEGDKWLYYDQGYLSANWFHQNFDSNNNHWKNGITPIGYGDKKIITHISAKGKTAKQLITKYFRKKIIINNLEDFVVFEMKIKRDDGILIYINGIEVFRNNMPFGRITGTTFSLERIQSIEETKILSKMVSPKTFKIGENSIDISIHQYDIGSSDCVFSLELIGYKNFNDLSKTISGNPSENSKFDYDLLKLNHEFQLEKATLKSGLIEHSNQSLKYAIFIISILLVLSLIGIYFLLYNQRGKEKITQEKIINLNVVNINQEKEMMTLSTKLLHNKQYLKELKYDLISIKTTDLSSIKNITKNIDQTLKNDNDWENLKTHFDAVYSGFYDKLVKLHPSLTETELRHCMFIKTHLQTKEIARILLIDPRSVQTSRYRIKKKMNLEENIDLREYLLNL